MARALLLPGSNFTLQQHPKLVFQDGAYTYTIERRGQTPTYTVTDGASTLSIPIRWTFGLDSQTYVLEHEGRLYESRVSFYPAVNGLDITMGDQGIHPGSIVEAMGRELSQGEARSCFQCHATNAIADDRILLESLTPGVQCGHCHVGAGAHAQDIARGKLDSVPPKLRNLSAEAMSTFCGQCHRSWAEVVRNRLFSQVNVRFQPYRLAKSKCFDGSDARISCTACHDPHRQVVRDAKSYDANCLACHAPSHDKAAKQCPVAASGCVTCHMPKTQLPGAHHEFTDHYIRVVKANESYAY